MNDTFLIVMRLRMIQGSVSNELLIRSVLFEKEIYKMEPHTERERTPPYTI